MHKNSYVFKMITQLYLGYQIHMLSLISNKCVIYYFPYVMLGDSTPTLDCDWQSNQRDSSVWGFSTFALISAHMPVCLFVSYLLTKQKTIQTWKSVHTLPYTMSENGFFIFSKNCSRGLLSLKNCRITWFSLYPSTDMMYIFFLYVLVYMSVYLYMVSVSHRLNEQKSIEIWNLIHTRLQTVSNFQNPM